MVKKDSSVRLLLLLARRVKWLDNRKELHRSVVNSGGTAVKIFALNFGITISSVSKLSQQVSKQCCLPYVFHKKRHPKYEQ